MPIQANRSRQPPGCACPHRKARLLPSGPAACPALLPAEQAWGAIFGPYAPRIQLQLLSGQVFAVSAGHAPDRGHPLGRGWREAARAMHLQPGNTLTLRGTARPGGAGAQAGGAGEPRALATVLRAPAADPAAAAAGGASTTGSPAKHMPPDVTAAGGRDGGGGTPLAGRKRTAEEAGLLRSPGGTIRQLCVDKMLAAARTKQACGASPQQHQPAAQLQQQQVCVKEERQDEEGQQRQQQQEQQHQQRDVPAELQATQPMDGELLPAAPPRPQTRQQQPAEQQREATQAAARPEEGGSKPPPPPAAPCAPTAAAPAAAAAGRAAAGLPADPSPYEFYSWMKPAVMACGLPGRDPAPRACVM